MAGMKRFIAYIYGYENAKKAGNTGFARIELRGEECRLEIHLRSVYAAQTHCRVYLFRKQGNQMEGSLIGEMDVRNGAGDFATAMKTMHIPTSSLSFFEMDGIFLCSEDGRIFMSRWTEGEPLTVDMEHFGEWRESQPEEPPVEEEVYTKEDMHKREDIKAVELATMTFGQSFQITPIQMAVTVSSMVNGGRRVTPHLGVSVLDKKGKTVKTFKYGEKEGIVSEKTSETMQELLEKVVSEGSGKNAYLEGYSIGGKTATSQTLPRSAGKYISSFIGFAPADDPQILGMVIIHDPQGIYYGGTIAAPVLRDIYDNVLPYLGIEKK